MTVMTTLTLQGDHITLAQAVKAAGLAGSGGQAKQLVRSGAFGDENATARRLRRSCDVRHLPLHERPPGTWGETQTQAPGARSLVKLGGAIPQRGSPRTTRGK